MILREKYLSQIRPFYDSDLVKVITGIRRCGKSVILETIMKELKEKTDNIIYLNFESSIDFAKASTNLELIEYVEAHKKSGKCYILLDEIQEIEDWQVAIKDLRLKDTSIFITGSNSKLLSSEMLSLLSGRFVSFRIRPFVYKEIEAYAKELGRTMSVTDYLIWGGFPGRLTLQEESAIRTFIIDLENTIVIHDIIQRYKIKKASIFKKIVNYIVMNNARIFSARSIHKYVKTQIEDISINTIIKYIEYLKEAYIIDEIPYFSTKAKAELRYYGKIYNSDVCFNSIKVSNSRYDLDHNLENIVYNELLYMGYEVKVFDNKGKEIDFIATKEGKTYLIQVAYSVVDEKAYEREFGAFAAIDNANQKIIITTDQVDFSTSTVKHIRLDDFLKLEQFE